MWNLPNAVWTVAKEEAFSWYFSFLGGHFLGRRTNYERNVIVMPVVFVVLAKRLVTHFWNWSRWSLTALMTRLENTLLQILLFYLRAKENGVVFFLSFSQLWPPTCFVYSCNFFPPLYFSSFHEIYFLFLWICGKRIKLFDISTSNVESESSHAFFFLLSSHYGEYWYRSRELACHESVSSFFFLFISLHSFHSALSV